MEILHVINTIDETNTENFENSVGFSKHYTGILLLYEKVFPTGISFR